LKGRGFSRAVSVAKSMAALAADALPSYQDDFFRSLPGRQVSAFSPKSQELKAKSQQPTAAFLLQHHLVAFLQPLQ
jgi:hypothetical protein